MPSPSTQRGLLSLPFRTGLSQKQDERWLEQGAMFSAENVVKKKTNTFEKRVGFTALGTTSFAIGRSLGTLQGSLLAIGKYKKILLLGTGKAEAASKPEELGGALAATLVKEKQAAVLAQTPERPLVQLLRVGVPLIVKGTFLCLRQRLISLSSWWIQILLLVFSI